MVRSRPVDLVRPQDLVCACCKDEILIVIVYLYITRGHATTRSRHGAGLENEPHHNCVNKANTMSASTFPSWNDKNIAAVSAQSINEFPIIGIFDRNIKFSLRMLINKHTVPCHFVQLNDCTFNNF